MSTSLSLPEGEKIAEKPARMFSTPTIPSENTCNLGQKLTSTKPNLSEVAKHVLEIYAFSKQTIMQNLM